VSEAAAASAEGLPRGLLPLVAVDLRQVTISEGLRAALACGGIVAINAWAQWPPLMQAALGALLTCLADPGGPIRKRLPALVSFAVLGALGTMACEALRSAPVPVVVPVAALIVFACAYARVAGQSALQVGNLLAVVAVLALRQPIHDVATALSLGGMFLAGGLWAVLLVLALWRIYPFGPARRAVAAAYDEVAALAADLRALLHSPAPADAHWVVSARAARRRAVRQAIENARAALLATVRERGPNSARAAQTWVRLEACEQILFAIVGLSDLLATDGNTSARQGAERILRLLRPVLRLVARGIETDSTAFLPRLDRAATAIAAVGRQVPELQGAADALAERVKIAVAVAAPAGWTQGTTKDESLRQALARVAALARGNLNLQSEVLRHALRATLAAAIAFAVTLTWPTSYGHWATIVLILTMQPYVAHTYARALERIGGTVAGGLVAAGLAMVCTTPFSVALACLPLAVLAFTLRPASFGLFMTALTPLVILLTELGRPDQPEWYIAGARTMAVLLGSGLAVLAVLFLWPSWEKPRVTQGVRTALRAYGTFARAEIGARLGLVPRAELASSRRAAGLAAINLESTLHRALLEPHGNEVRLEAALTVDAALRRIGGRLSALDIAGGAPADPQAWQRWGDWLGTALQHLADDRAIPARPPLPAADPQAETLARMALQVELVAGALGRLVAP
jgi:uncharacterized membrane protein YccC